MSGEHHERVVARMRSSHSMLQLVAGVPMPGINPKAMPSMFKNAAEHDDARWTMLGVCLAANDFAGVQLLWQSLRSNCKTRCGPLMSKDVRRIVFQTPSHIKWDESRYMTALQGVICTCRKPALGLFILNEFICTYTHNLSGGISVESRQDLAAVVVAIADAIFSSDISGQRTYEEDHRDWEAAFVQSDADASDRDEPCRPDKATDLNAWKKLIEALLDVIGAGALPERIVETLSRERKYSLSLLQVAVRNADHDLFVLKQLLFRKEWPAAFLAEAFLEALDKKLGVRGPNLRAVIRLLYEKQLWQQHRLAECETQRTECLQALKMSWKRVISVAIGYDDIEIDTRTIICVPSQTPNPKHASSLHPDMWMDILREMANVHVPAPEDTPSGRECDQSSDLFGQIIAAALQSCLGTAHKTHIVEYLIDLAVRNGTVFWHELSDLVENVALEHPDAFPQLVKSMLTDAESEQQQLNVQRFQKAFSRFIQHPANEPLRMVVKALKPYSLPTSIWNDVCKMHESALSRWIVSFGCGAGAYERRVFGGDYVAFVNGKMEDDLLAVLAGAEWTDTDLTAALEVACKAKMAIATQVLLRPPCNAKLSDKLTDDPWVAAVSEFLYRPGQRCAQEVITNLETQAASLEGAPRRTAEEPPADAPAAKRARGA